MRARSLVFHRAAIAAAALLAAGAVHAQAAPAEGPPPAYLGRYQSSEADRLAILQVADDFRAALAAHDAKRLAALLLNDGILFTSPASPERVRRVRAERNPFADGIARAGAVGFLEFVATSRVPIEERFHHLRLTQDGHVAWLMFDFEFIEDGRVDNHGVETWQLVKTADERWKILSVVWTSHGSPP